MDLNAWNRLKSKNLRDFAPKGAYFNELSISCTFGMEMKLCVNSQVNCLSRINSQVDMYHLTWFDQ